MPRASYGDRHCITVIHGKMHVALDFTSRIIDFFIIRHAERHTGRKHIFFQEVFSNDLVSSRRRSSLMVFCPPGCPSALVVLVEEELVVIDLQTEGWPVIQTPYLVPLHSSAITCSHHISTIPLKLWERIIAAGALQSTHYSKKVC